MSDIEQLEAILLNSLVGQCGELHLSIGAQLAAAATLVPDQPAIMEPQRAALSYAGLLRLAQRTVRGLNALGFGPADRIALALPNGTDTAAIYLCVMSGAAILPLGIELAALDYELYLRQSQATALLVREASAPAARQAAAALGIRLIEVVHPDPKAIGFELVAVPDDPHRAPQFAAPDDVALLMSTSGTTARPKLVVRTHRQLALTAYQGFVQFNLPRTPQVTINMVPLTNQTGFGLLASSLVGRTGFVCAPAVDIELLYSYLNHYRPHLLTGVPALLDGLLKRAYLHKDIVQQLEIEYITTYSAPSNEKLLRELQDMFGVPVNVTYGATESYVVCTTTHDVYASAARLKSAGQALPFCRVRICSSTGEILPAGEHGEIVVRTPFLAGYYDNPEASAESFADNWYRSGDEGYLDADGYLFITGRVKEVINRGGSKIAPHDVDAVLLQHPAVRAAACFGFPHRSLGEDLAAAIVAADSNVTERELRLFALERLPLNKVPSRFVFVDEIPRTANGKILRTSLAERFKAELGR